MQQGGDDEELFMPTEEFDVPPCVPLGHVIASSSQDLHLETDALDEAPPDEDDTQTISVYLQHSYVYRTLSTFGNAWPGLLRWSRAIWRPPAK